ncbi:MAG: ribokinase [Ilumatobacteraceae bacterium]|nr:ribokinase [Ilumatobacteraceae bacterium]
MGDSTEFDVVVVGSCNLDLVSTTEHLPSPGETLRAVTYAEHAGGKGLNQAVACARMGARTALIGCVGNDSAGQMLRELLNSEGIDTSQLITVDAPTGRAFITVDASGENTIVIVAGANAQVGNTAITVPHTKVILAQLEIPLPAIAQVFAQAQDAIRVLNPAPATTLSTELLALCDIAVPNETESTMLGGAQFLLGAGVATVVTTLGERGAEISNATSTTPIAPYTVDAIDTVGAGDAFTGALCAEIARGKDIQRAAQIASVAGALATTVRGAVPSLPMQAAVMSLYAD